MKEAPCKNCEKRGCGNYHDKCEAYKQYKEQQNAVSESKKKALMEEIPPRPYRHSKHSPIKCHKK
jgi:hypothetical protein